MKKPVIIILALAFISCTAFAQTGKGQKYLGGNIYLNYDEDGTSSISNFDSGYAQYSNYHILDLNISPEFGFFLSDKWTMGISPSYSRISGTETSQFVSFINSSTDSYVYTRDYHSDFVGLAIDFRYYIMLSDKVAIYPQFGVGTLHNVDSFSSGALSIGGGPNVVFFPTKKLGINMGFGNLNYSYDYESKGSNLSLGLNNNFTFGVNYYWGKK